MVNKILIRRKDRMVASKDSRFIGISGENLQEILIFNIDEPIEGTAVVEILFPDNTKGFVELNKTERGYELPIKSSLLKQQGYIGMQLIILQNNKEVFKSKITEFEVEEAINATETIPDQYPTWVDELETLKSNLENAESERVSAEQERVEAEQTRQENFTEMQEDVSNAISEIQDKKAEYDKNALDKTKAFNDNAIEKTNEFNTNVDTQTKTYNDNAKDKLDEYNKNDLEKTKAYNDNTDTKTNEFNEHVQSKTEEYDKHVENYNKRLDTVESKNIEQDKEIEKLKTECQVLKEENKVLKNQIPTGQAEGENITLNDSAEMEFKDFNVSGNSMQEIRKGHNILQNNATTQTIKGIEYKINEDKTVTIYGDNKETTNSQIHINSNLKLKEGTYTLYKEGDFKKYWIFINVYDGNTYIKTKSCSFDTTTVFTISKEEEKYIYDVGIEVKSGAGVYGVVVHPQIVKGEYTQESMPEYEAYGISPSPEFSSEIKNVINSANIMVFNENLFDGQLEFGGITQGNSVVNNLQIRSKNYNPIEPGEEYVISSPDYNITSANVNINFYDENKKFIYDRWSSNFITPDNARYYRFKILGKQDTTIKIKVKKGSFATEYKPQQSQQIIFPLTVGQRMYKDSYLADDGIHHKRGAVILKGIEEWTSLNEQNTNNTFYLTSTVIDNKISKINNDICCNVALKGNTWGSDIANIIQNSMMDSALRIRMAKNLINSIQEWKTYLAEQFAKGTPVIVEYELAEEVIEPYTEEQQKTYNKIKKAHSYKNVTHIFSTNETSPKYEVTYRKDLETINKNSEDRITALEATIIK